jgi:DNA helicase HerA-like ATPase
MYKRFRLWQVIQQLNLQGISILLFQQVVRTPAGGYSIKIRMRVGMTPTKFLKKAEAIAVALKAAEVDLERIKGNKFRVIVRKQVEKILPQYPMNASQPLIPMPLNYVPIGVNADGYQVGLPLFNSSGGTVTLIAGNPGQGKSSALKIILAGCVNSTASVIWFDPKSGFDANPFSSRVEVLSNTQTPEIFLDYLKRVQDLILRRNTLPSKEDLEFLPKIVVFIDEWGLLSALGTKPLQAEIKTAIRNLAATGRSTNVSLVLATQRPTSTNIDVATRELSNNRIAFQVGDTHGSEAVLGQPGAENKVDPLHPGQALVWLDGQLQRTTFYEVPKNLAAQCSEAAGMKRTLKEVEELEEIFRRERGI